MNNQTKINSGTNVYLKNVISKKWDINVLPKEFVPNRIKQVIEENRKKMGDINPHPPTRYQLEETWNILSQNWKYKGDITKLQPRYLRQVPWVLFYPPNSQALWLGKDEKFAISFLSWLKQNPRPSRIVTLLKVFLQYYPKMLSTFELWRVEIKKLLNEIESIRLELWRNRSMKYFFLEPDGCARFSGAYLKSQIPVDKIIEDSGLINELGRSAFLLEINDRILRHIEKKLNTDETELSLLDRTFSILEQDKNTLRFPERARSIPESLLRPFADNNHQPEVRDKMQTFLLKHFNDPRIKPAGWQGVNDDILAIMRRWLVAANLGYFFRLLDHTAYDKHWRYRNTFWSAYLKNNWISDAWVILGSKARKIAMEFIIDEATQHGILKAGGGVQSNQSVLMLKVGGLTVTEWSHSGKCHIWLPNNKSGPKFYEKSYSRFGLISNANHLQIHHASKKGFWQRRISGWIEDQTGIHLMTTEYMPR